MQQTTVVPAQLQDFFFCRVQPASKRPIDNNWNTCPLSYSQINTWLQQGKSNYGVIAGYNNLITIDFDNEDFYREIINKLTDTLIIKTPKRGFHVYYICKDISEFKKISNNSFNLEKNGKHLGEVRFYQVMTVGPGSVHPETLTRYEVYNNVPINEISAEKLLLIFSDYYSKERTVLIKEGDKNNDILKAISGLAVEERNGAFVGIHPVHGSATGANFHVSPAKGGWHCFRHGTGGDSLYLIAVREGIIDCSQAKPGGLHGENFIKTIKIAKEKYGIDAEQGIVWDLNDDGKIRLTVTNLMNFFKKDPELRDLIRFNELLERIEYARKNIISVIAGPGTPITDTDLILLKVYLAKKNHIHFSTQLVFEAVSALADQNKHHPVKQYLESLEWDKTPRLNTWLSAYAGSEDNEYTREIGSKLLVAAIARIYDPGVKFDYMLVLEGNQGIGKSQLLNALGGDWYIDINFGRDKDMVSAMRMGWIIEISELSGIGKREVEEIRAFVSRQTDVVRLPYERLTRTYPRKNIFIGTINPDGDNSYLTDSTGARRFWPVPCHEIKLEEFKRDRDQLWAEAYLRFKGGESLYIKNKSAEFFANFMQEERSIEDVWTEPIKKFIKQNINNQITALQIAESLGLTKDKIESRHLVRIGRVSKKLGGIKRQVRDGKERLWIYDFSNFV